MELTIKKNLLRHAISVLKICLKIKNQSPHCLKLKKKYFEKCVSASNDKYAAEEVIYDIGVGFVVLIVLLGIGWGFYEAKKSLNTPMIINPKENTENGTNGDHITNGVIIVLFSIIIAAFIYLIFSFVSGIWISIKY